MKIQNLGKKLKFFQNQNGLGESMNETKIQFFFDFFFWRFPWESAFTGIDVTVDEYPDIIKYQQHITSDIGHALRQHFFATQDLSWFRTIGCDLTYGTAQFWESRVKWNETTHRYNINGVMGPDEDHSNINNNAFTNVGAALNLHFGTYVIKLIFH